MQFEKKGAQFDEGRDPERDRLFIYKGTNSFFDYKK